MSADESHVLHCIFKSSDTFHAIKRINASQSIKTIGVFFACSCNNFIRHVIATRHADSSCMSSNEKCFLNARGFHPLKHFIQGQSSHERVLCIHLSNKEIVAPIGSLREGFSGPNIHHRIDGFVIVIIFFTHAENDSKSWANIL